MYIIRLLCLCFIAGRMVARLGHHRESKVSTPIFAPEGGKKIPISMVVRFIDFF